MDGMELERHVAELRGLAEATRRAAARAAAADGVEWRSTAAQRFREVLAREATRTRRCADLLDDAAHALAAHVRAVHARTDVAPGPRGAAR